MAIVWLYGSFDFIANGAVPDSLRFVSGWRTSPVIIPGRHGVFVGADTRRDAARFSISGNIYASTATDLRQIEDDLRQVLSASANFYIHNDRYISVIAESFAWEIVKVPGLIAAAFSIDVLATDAVWVSNTLNQSSFSTPGTPTLTNSGSAPSPPTISITAPVAGLTQVILSNTTSGDTLTWNGSITSGEVLVIDMEDMSIAVAGSSDPSGFSSGSAFWSLEPGNNSVSISSTPTAAATVISWRDRWL